MTQILIHYSMHGFSLSFQQLLPIGMNNKGGHCPSKHRPNEMEEPTSHYEKEQEAQASAQI